MSTTGFRDPDAACGRIVVFPFRHRFHANDNKSIYCFLEFHLEERDASQSTPIGRLTFELFKDQAPETCENFRALCTGEKGRSEKSDTALYYKNSIIHRIVPNGWIQGR